MRVFLGGTCNGSTWREQLIEQLEVDCFNPVVDDWNEEAQQRELHERETCDFVLYCITPKMTGVYSVAEVVDDSNKRPGKTLFVPLRHDGAHRFEDGQWRSIIAVRNMVERNGARWFSTLGCVAVWLNNGGEYPQEGGKN